MEEDTKELKEFLATFPTEYWIAAREVLQERHAGSWDGTETKPISDAMRTVAESVILWTYFRLTGHL